MRGGERALGVEEQLMHKAELESVRAFPVRLHVEEAKPEVFEGKEEGECSAGVPRAAQSSGATAQHSAYGEGQQRTTAQGSWSEATGQSSGQEQQHTTVAMAEAGAAAQHRGTRSQYCTGAMGGNSSTVHGSRMAAEHIG